MTSSLLPDIYDRLLAHFGPQHWWPAESPFEVMIGAILTQNTNWTNVERAIANLKQQTAFTPQALLELPPFDLAQLIRPAGYLNVKTKRLRNFLEFFVTRFQGEIAQMRALPQAALRDALLSVQGIGPETADAILLYAVGSPSFVIDAYTHRVLHRHHLTPDETSYDEMQSLFHAQLPPDVAQWNEYHALLVATGKTYCRPRNPQCQACPLNGLNWRGTTPTW